MAGFDDPGLFYADRFFAEDGENQHLTNRDEDLRQAKHIFRKFFREFNRGRMDFCYREMLKNCYASNSYAVGVNLNDLKSFDAEIGDNLKKRPSIFMPPFEDAAREVAFEICVTKEDQKTRKPQEIQILLDDNDYPKNIRDVKSTEVSHLVKIPGIIIAASQVRSKASKITLQCRTCRHTKPDIELKPGLEGYAMPRRCGADQANQGQKCPMDPYFIVPDRCKCVDFQILKLQENPENVPHGEMPRHLQLYCERNLTDQVAPGNRVTVMGVYAIKKAFTKPKGIGSKDNVGIRAPYLRVLGIKMETAGPGRTDGTKFTGEEEEKFRELAKQNDVQERIAKSIAPSIYGSLDIKKAIACLLFAGSRKRLPDGLTRRGDINVLLLGDPGTAKSQLLKFVERVAPIGVYTSGKGSSAAGLTASVVRDPASRNFIMEGGAMVLADGGVVCIDEFDKMREDDRVAIHEAMEQQTISIAKAGITTTLNSRCSVLAAANSVYGRWDESKGDDNIDFMPTILSRFDMIFVVKDEHNAQRDMTLAKHVIQVHVQAADAIVEDAAEGELSLEFLKKYIGFCRSRCGPRLSAPAGQKLVNHYVQLRNPVDAQGVAKKSSIPLTVRQLEAVVRMSESLAKMELAPFATERHVEEALRLFRVSTLEAAQSGNLVGVEGFTSEEDQENLNRVEKQVKRRFAIGSQVSEHVILQDFVRQGYKELSIRQVLTAMVRRGELQHRMQRKMLFRVK